MSTVAIASFLIVFVLAWFYSDFPESKYLFYSCLVSNVVCAVSCVIAAFVVHEYTYVFLALIVAIAAVSIAEIFVAKKSVNGFVPFFKKMR